MDRSIVLEFRAELLDRIQTVLYGASRVGVTFDPSLNRIMSKLYPLLPELGTKFPNWDVALLYFDEVRM